MEKTLLIRQNEKAGSIEGVGRVRSSVDSWESITQQERRGSTIALFTMRGRTRRLAMSLLTSDASVRESHRELYVWSKKVGNLSKSHK